jgi:HEAT repeat protein
MSQRSTGGRALSASRLAPGAFVIALSILVAVLRAVPARAGVAPNDEGTAVASVDPARVQAFLGAVRGTSAVACELAARTVEGRNWNGRGSVDGSAADSAARTLVYDVVDGSGADPAAIPVLRAALGDDDSCVRRLAAPLLGRIDEPQAATALLAALADARPTTRHAAAVGLAYVNRARAVDVQASLVKALGDAEADVRAASAWALGRRETRGATVPLAAALGDREPRVRRAVAYALGAIEDPAAVVPLTGALRDDRDVEVRRAAAWALGQIK